MRIRVPLLGTGVPGDAWRVSLPTYSMVDMDVARGIAVVDLPDADVPTDGLLRAALAVGGADLTAPNQAPMVAAFRNQWAAHLDNRYREHAGEFRPDRK